MLERQSQAGSLWASENAAFLKGGVSSPSVVISVEHLDSVLEDQTFVLIFKYQCHIRLKFLHYSPAVLHQNRTHRTKLTEKPSLSACKCSEEPGLAS